MVVEAMAEVMVMAVMVVAAAEAGEVATTTECPT